MVGPNIKFNTCEEDDLYIPVKSRKNKNKNNKDFIFNVSTDIKVDNNNTNDNNIDNCFNNGKLKLNNNNDNNNNISRFLEATIPTIVAQYFLKTTVKGWKTCDVEYHHYFTLGDLWESFKECSAYGVGVPLVIDGIDDEIVQYYVPYLSAIQLYAQSPQLDAKSSGRHSDGDSKTSSCEDSSGDEFEDDVNYSTVSEHFVNKADEVPSNSLSSPGINHELQEGFCSNETVAESSRGEVLFQFFEKESPHCREPLASKVCELGSLYPPLKTLRSCDLHPCSWISVAWYPIYRIPSWSTLKDLDACFLTYHCLSTPLEGEGSSDSAKLIDSSDTDSILRFSLPSFGLGFYKFKGVVWTGKRDSECPLVNSLTESADRWLKKLEVNHPDSEFFLSRTLYQR